MHYQCSAPALCSVEYSVTPLLFPPSEEGKRNSFCLCHDYTTHPTPTQQLALAKTSAKFMLICKDTHAIAHYLSTFHQQRV